MDLKVGHYSIVIDGNEIVYARFDGNHFFHEKGKSHPDHVKVNNQSDPPTCSPLCHCTTNPDGTVTQICS